MSLINRMRRMCRMFITGDPLVKFSKLLAINPPNRWGRIYTATCSLVFISLTFGAGLHYIHLADQLTYVVKFSLWLQLFALSTIVLSDWAVVLISPRNFRPPAKELKNIEASLEGFGFRVDDRTLRTRLGLLQIFFSFGQPIACGFPDVSRIINGPNFPYRLFHVIHYVSALTCINVSEFLFVNYLYMIKRRFKELNRIISNINRELVSGGPVPLNRFKDEIRYRLHVMRKAHFDLTRIAKQVDESFGLHLLMSFTFSTAIITELCYQQYESVASNHLTTVKSFYTIFTWTGYQIMRLSLMILASSFTCAEANMAATLIQAMPIEKTSQNLKDEVFHFSLQVQNQLSFTAAGFFEINFNAFKTISSAIVTYLVIMLQMGKVN